MPDPVTLTFTGTLSVGGVVIPVDLLLKVGTGGSSEPAEPTVRVLAVDGASFLSATVPAGELADRMFRVAYGDGVVSAFNFARGGQTVSNMDAEADDSGLLDSKVDATPGAMNVLLYGGGETLNELQGFSLAQMYASMVGYTANRRAAGWDKLLRYTEQDVDYEDATLAEVGGDAGALAWLQDYANTNRGLILAEVDANTLLYCDEQVDFRDGGDAEDMFHADDACDRHLLVYGEPSHATSVGRSHPTQYGVMKKLTFAMPRLCELFVLPAPHEELLAKLVEFWPLFDDGAVVGVTPYKYWWGGGKGHRLNMGANAVVEADWARLGIGLFDASYLVTVAAGGGGSHILSRANFPAYTYTVNLYCLSNAGDGFNNSPRHILGIWHHGNSNNQSVTFYDSVAQRIKFRTSRDGGLVNVDTITSTVPIAANTRYSVAAGIDADGRSFLSVNGEAKVRSASPLTLHSSGSENLYVGFGQNVGFSARYSGVGFWAGELSDAAVAYLYNGGVPRATLFGEE